MEGRKPEAKRALSAPPSSRHLHHLPRPRHRPPLNRWTRQRLKRKQNPRRKRTPTTRGSRKPFLDSDGGEDTTPKGYPSTAALLRRERLTKISLVRNKIPSFRKTSSTLPDQELRHCSDSYDQPATPVPDDTPNPQVKDDLVITASEAGRSVATRATEELKIATSPVADETTEGKDKRRVAGATDAFSAAAEKKKLDRTRIRRNPTRPAPDLPTPILTSLRGPTPSSSVPQPKRAPSSTRSPSRGLQDVEVSPSLTVLDLRIKTIDQGIPPHPIL
ncbi:hypothetical protein QR680_012195 [Steinernema hermaphroditum]|uniref:Uncharacterized protein n=1 Tax=Steinernema hermaphroditum TaxID=289476 RepID=A0AA39M0B9_9BILA|nr:hypothetical protein QR680_012195 [Steinernema hermaphroditum]